MPFKNLKEQKKVREAKMKVFICSKCGTVVEKDLTPSSVGCPKGGSHSWHVLSYDGSLTPKPGLHPYQCRNCGTLIYSKTTPSSVGCLSGGSHSWIRL